MSSGLVNPVATETSSTCRAGGGGGVTWLDLPPLQPRKQLATNMHKSDTQQDTRKRADIDPPGWKVLLCQGSANRVEAFTSICVNTLQNLTRYSTKRRLRFCGKI